MKTRYWNTETDSSVRQRFVVAALLFLLTTILMIAAPVISGAFADGPRALIIQQEGRILVTARRAPGEPASGVYAEDEGKQTDKEPGIALLTWINGDTIRGNLVSGDNNSFNWQSPLFKGNYELDAESIESIVFDRNDDNQTVESDPFMLRMISGDLFFCDIDELDEEFVHVSSRRHGEFKIIRDRIARIVQLENTGMIYMGPDDPENWDSFGNEKSRWKIKDDGSLSTSDKAYAYRPLKIPDVVNYEIALSWDKKADFVFGLDAPSKIKGLDQILRIETWADELVLSHSDGDFEPLMTLERGQKELKLQIVIDRNMDADEDGETDTTNRVVIFDQLGTRLTDVIVDGPGRFTEPGFYIQNKGDSLSFDAINIRKASGFELMESASDSSSINLADGTVINGTIESFSKDDGIWKIKSDGEIRDVAVANFGSVTFAGSAALVGGENLVARYFDTSHVSGELESVADGSLNLKTDYSPDPLRCTLADMRSIEFPEREKDDGKFEGEHVLYFPGGQFKGRIEEGSGEEGDIVRWRPAGAKNGLPIVSGDARFVIQSKSNQKTDSGDLLDILYLENRDTIPCRIVSIDAEMVYFESFTERDRVRQDEVRAIDFSGSSPNLPDSFEDESWVRPNRGVKFEDGNAIFSKTVKLGHGSLMAASRVSFDLKFSGTEHTQMTLSLFEKDANAPRGDISFTLMLWDGQLYATGKQQNQFNSVQQLEDNKASIEFVAGGGTITMKCNGRKIVEEAVNLSKIEGRGFVIQMTQIDGDSVTFSNLKFGGSKGVESIFVTDETKERLLTIPRLSLKNPPQHILCAENDDLLRGRLTGLKDGKARIVSRMEEFTIPREKLTSIIWLHPEKYLNQDEDETEGGDAVEDEAADDEVAVNEADADANDDEADDSAIASAPADADGAQKFQIVVTNGSRLTLSAREWSDGKFVGESESLGECRVPLEQIRELRMGSYATGASDIPYTDWIPKAAPEPKLVGSGPDGTGEERFGMASALVGKEIKQFTMKLADGTEFSFDKHKGKIIVLDFWATWCGPCVKALPEVIAATGEFEGEEVIFIAVNQQETLGQIETFLENRELDMQVGLDPDGKIGRMFDVSSIPQTVIIGPDGKVARSHIGAVPQLSEKLREAIQEILDEEL